MDHGLHADMIIHTTVLNIQFLQVTFSFSVTMRDPLLTLQLGQVGVDVRAKHRHVGRGSLPPAVGILATMLLQPELMIAEDSVKLRFHKSILAQLLATLGAGVLTDVMLKVPMNCLRSSKNCPYGHC